MRLAQYIRPHTGLTVSTIAAICLAALLALSSCKEKSSELTATADKPALSQTGITAATNSEEVFATEGKPEESVSQIMSEPIHPAEISNKFDKEGNIVNPNLNIFETTKDNTIARDESALDKRLAELREEYNPIYKITRGDTMEIAIPFEPDTKMMVNVRPDGTLGYMYGVEVQAAGLTYPELQSAMEKQLEKYYIKPKVDINGKTYSGSQVFVMGPVNHPGGHIVQNNTKLVDFLSMAGVLSRLPSSNLLSYSNSRVTNDVIDLSHSYIMRDGKILPIDFERLLLRREMKFNIYVRSNDFLFFPSSYLSDISKTVYIIGAVVTPRTFQYTTDTSFMAAIASSGGLDKYRADRKHCVVIRKDSEDVININYSDIIDGKSKDIPLMDSDIIFVPERGLYAASRWTTTIIDEIVAPLQAIIQGSSATKAINNHDWNPSAEFGPTDSWMKDDNQ